MGILLAICSGLVAGWLVNYLSDVLPTQRALVQPFCQHCGQKVNWKDTLLLSACKACAKPRSWRSYIIMATALCLSLLLWFNPPARMGYWIGLIVISYFGVVVVIDLEHRLILHSISFAGLLIGVLAGTFQHNLVTSLLGGLTGLLVMLIFYGFGILFARYRARKLGTEDGEEALGFGDVTLSVVLGLMLGWPYNLFGLLIGVLAGGVFSLLLVISLIALRKYQSMTIFTAYGPYLVFGAALLLFFPQTLTILLGR